MYLLQRRFPSNQSSRGPVLSSETSNVQVTFVSPCVRTTVAARLADLQRGLRRSRLLLVEDGDAA